MTELGTQLRAARLEKGFAIADLSAITHIRAVYLDALETGDYDRLPGRSYGLGFVKSVARELGLNIAEIAQKFSFETAAMEQSQPHPMFVGFEKGGQPRLQMLLAAALLAVAGLVLWKAVSPSRADVTGMVEEVPDHIVRAAAAPESQPNARVASQWRAPRQRPDAEPAAPQHLAAFTVR